MVDKIHIDIGDVHKPAQRQNVLDVLERNKLSLGDLINYWKGLRSALPPPLPTEKQEL